MLIPRSTANNRSITSPLLAAYVEGLFSRSPLVGGRTVSGLVVGLGDAGVGELTACSKLTADATTIILYGQRDGESLRLCVGRRRDAPAPAEKKIRPGEPLPRGECCRQTPIDSSASLLSRKPAEEAAAAVPEPAQHVAGQQRSFCERPATCCSAECLASPSSLPRAKRAVTRAKRGETAPAT